MALLEPQKCCILQWFLSLFGNKRPPGAQRFTTGRSTAPKAKRPPGTFCFRGPKGPKNQPAGIPGGHRGPTLAPPQGRRSTKQGPPGGRREARRPPQRAKTHQKAKCPSGTFCFRGPKAAKKGAVSSGSAFAHTMCVRHKHVGANTYGFLRAHRSSGTYFSGNM